MSRWLCPPWGTMSVVSTNLVEQAGFEELTHPLSRLVRH
jgi:hypothetical protein